MGVDAFWGLGTWRRRCFVSDKKQEAGVSVEVVMACVTVERE